MEDWAEKMVNDFAKSMGSSYKVRRVEVKDKGYSSYIVFRIDRENKPVRKRWDFSAYLNGENVIDVIDERGA